MGDEVALLDGRHRPGARRRIAAARSAASSRSAAARHDDSGVTLILALVFLVVGALAVTALVSFAGGALLNTANLQSQRAVEYAADSATEIAVQAVRYRPDYYATAANCLTPTPATSQSITIDTHAMSVYCSGTTTSNSAPVSGPGAISATLHKATSSSLFTTVPGTPNVTTFKGWEITDSLKKIPATSSILTESNASHSVTMSKPATAAASTDYFTLVPPRERTVSFYTCPTARAPCNKANAIVTAVVDFNDSSSVGHECTSSSSQSCGTSMTIASWVERYANH